MGSCWKKKFINGVLQIKLSVGEIRVGYDVLNVSDGSYVPMVRHRAFLPRDWEEAFVLGEFSFSAPGIERAVNWIREGLNEKFPMVIDEVGPVEINGLGFYDVLTELFRGETGVPEVYVIVRKRILGKMIDTFGIKDKEYVLIDLDTIN